MWSGQCGVTLPEGSAANGQGPQAHSCHQPTKREPVNESWVMSEQGACWADKDGAGSTWAPKMKPQSSIGRHVTR